MEEMRRQQQWQPAGGASAGGGRVKVFMPQQYNSPMGMYSAHNVLETFTAQAESMLDTLEKFVIYTVFQKKQKHPLILLAIS